MRSLLFLAFVALLVVQCSAHESMQNDYDDEQQFPPGPPPSNEMGKAERSATHGESPRGAGEAQPSKGNAKMGGPPKGEKPNGVPPTGSPPAEREKRSLAKEMPKWEDEEDGQRETSRLRPPQRKIKILFT
ncbi:hypothetical protein niasHS_000163 [Heterodera schachtii]|uniref:Secreted protein n=1 Tax=Heterodera schachtii TaxID=97005 RepID=A0ABD2KPA9_HETSC